MDKKKIINRKDAIKKRGVLPSIIFLGILLYIQGYIFVSKLNTIMMLVGGLVIFGSFLIISYRKRKTQRLIGNILMIVSLYFIAMLIYAIFIAMRSM
ncbi:hypothetical protein [Clostridium aciditolerans]|uniref:Uncharacterized protein n=1 Tax=Clostridium aciditolerans TaxID=339861 RepID=A0A934M5P6_9CLOT|nr:hypothetical protein [Clostridium aciditolerans]MBI6872236.1 hypothetical protein [Clostridium aciditolerans]